MISLVPTSSVVVFPLAEQKHYTLREAANKRKFLLSGVNQSAVFSEQEGAFVQTDSIVVWADKEYFQIGSGDTVKVFDDQNNTIAGVRIRVDGGPITDMITRSEVVEALSKLTFNVCYHIKKPSGREEGGQSKFFCALNELALTINPLQSPCRYAQEWQNTRSHRGNAAQSL